MAMPSNITANKNLANSLVNINESNLTNNIIESEHKEIVSSNKHGETDAEEVQYLGRAMLSHFATGIGAIQRPLANLYCKTMMETGGLHALVPRCMVSFNAGIVVRPVTNPDSLDDAQREILQAAFKKKTSRLKTTPDIFNGLLDISNDKDKLSKINQRLYQSQILHNGATASKDNLLLSNKGFGNRLSADPRLYQSQLITSNYEKSPEGQLYGSSSSLVQQTEDLTRSHLSDQVTNNLDASTELVTKPTYPLFSILFSEAVQFVLVRGEDKKLRYAFQPFRKPAGRANGKKLFSLLDTRFHWLRNVEHLPIFACVVRRAHGLKSIDIHAFLWKKQEQAIRLTEQLEKLCKYGAGVESSQVSKAGAFSYQPFSRQTGRSAVDTPVRPSSKKCSPMLQPSISKRRLYGSSPSLNLSAFSIGTPCEAYSEQNDAYRSSMDLTTLPEENEISVPAAKQNGSSLDSKLKESDYANIGKFIFGANKNSDRRENKPLSKKLFSFGGEKSVRSQGHTENVNKSAVQPKIRSRPNSLVIESVQTKASQEGKSNSLPTNDGTTNKHGIFYLVQADFNPVKKNPETLNKPVINPSAYLIKNKERNADSTRSGVAPDDSATNKENVLNKINKDENIENEIYIKEDLASYREDEKCLKSAEQIIIMNSHETLYPKNHNSTQPAGQINKPYDDVTRNYTPNKSIYSDTIETNILEVSNNASLLSTNLSDSATNLSTNSSLNKGKVIEVNFQGRMHVHTADPVLSPKHSPSYGRRLSQIRFVYYDDLEDSKPINSREIKSPKSPNPPTGIHNSSHILPVPKTADFNSSTSIHTVSTKHETVAKPPTNEVCALSNHSHMFGNKTFNFEDTSVTAPETSGKLFTNSSSVNDLNRVTSASMEISNIKTGANSPYFVSGGLQGRVISGGSKSSSTPSSSNPTLNDCQRSDKRLSVTNIPPALESENSPLRPELKENNISKTRISSHLANNSSNNERDVIFPSKHLPIRTSEPLLAQSFNNLPEQGSRQPVARRTSDLAHKKANWEFKCAPSSVTSDYCTLGADDILEPDLRHGRSSRYYNAVKKDAEIESELGNISVNNLYECKSFDIRNGSEKINYNPNFEQSMVYFP